VVDKKKKKNWHIERSCSNGGEEKKNPRSLSSLMNRVQGIHPLDGQEANDLLNGHGKRREAPMSITRGSTLHINLEKKKEASRNSLLS